MKKMIMLVAILFSMATMAQEAVMTFNKTTHDFGKINEADGRVTTIFEVKNEGMAPLVLTNVRASCGCTTPKWTRDEVDSYPMKSNEVKALCIHICHDCNFRCRYCFADEGAYHSTEPWWGRCT